MTNNYKDINIYYQNVRSIKNKEDDFKELILGGLYDIICLCETWLTIDTLNILTFANELNWKYLYQIRKNKKGGGLLILTKPGITYSEEYNSDTHELIQITIRDPFKLCISLLYNPPGNTSPNWDSIIDDCIHKASAIVPLIILGDFNIPTWKPPVGVPEVQAILEEHNLLQKIEFPTRGNNYLDLLMTRNIEISAITNSSMFISDHCGFEFTAKCPITNCRSSSTHRIVRDYFMTNWKVVNHLIADLSDKYSIPEATESQIDSIIEELSNILSTHIPKKKILSSKIPWMDADLYTLLKKKNRFHKIWKIRGSEMSYLKYSNIRHEFKQLLRLKTKDFLLRHQSEYKNDPKLFWKTLMRGKTIPLNTVITPQDFADHFSKLVCEERTLIDPINEIVNCEAPSLLGIHIESDAVRSICLSKKFTTKSSPDILNGKVLKYCANSLSPLLTKIFVRTSSLGYYPSAWKISSIFPLHKKDSKSDVANYRQITIQPLMGKIFDKIIYDSLYPHVLPFVKDYNHYGIKGRSVNTNLLCKLSYILEAFEDSKQTDVVYADIAKAFDNVAHKYLLFKLKTQFGIDGMLLKLLTSYLENRISYVRLNDVCSRTFKVTKGIPQGGILSPLLFVLFTNDIYIGDECKILTYADDVKLFAKRPYSSENKTTLQNAINLLIDWTLKWGLELNVKKTKTISFTQMKKFRNFSDESNIFALGNKIEQVMEYKDLGIIFDSALTFVSHLNSLNSRLRRSLGLLKYKFGWITDITARKILYNAIFLSHLDYGVVVWSMASPSNLLKITRTHNRAINDYILKRLSGTKTEYINSCRNAEILSLKDRSTMLALQIIKNRPPPDLVFLIPVRAAANRWNTRNALPYHMPRIRLSITGRSIRNTVPTFLNSLPVEVLNSFENDTNWKFIIKLHLLTKL